MAMRSPNNLVASRITPYLLGHGTSFRTSCSSTSLSSFFRELRDSNSSRNKEDDPWGPLDGVFTAVFSILPPRTYRWNNVTTYKPLFLFCQGKDSKALVLLQTRFQIIVSSRSVKFL
ncbi:hypothetical protein BSKO_03999 [Bryopsis sp. KO-2023]|nr:hypothetical protein BSKO_03999 [Bryopsis sp. KO-2023]